MCELGRVLQQDLGLNCHSGCSRIAAAMARIGTEREPLLPGVEYPAVYGNSSDLSAAFRPLVSSRKRSARAWYLFSYPRSMCIECFPYFWFCKSMPNVLGCRWWRWIVGSSNPF